MKASLVSRFSGRSTIWWVLGFILVSAGAGATTAAVANPPDQSVTQAVYGTALLGTTTIVSHQAITLGSPFFTGPAPAYAALPGDWKAFARVSEKKDGFQASVRVPYGSILLLHMPMASKANVDVPMTLKLDVPDGFDIDLEPSPDSAAHFTNLVGDAGKNAWYVTIPAGANIEMQLSIKVPVTTGTFNLQATLEADN